MTNNRISRAWNYHRFGHIIFIVRMVIIHNYAPVIKHASGSFKKNNKNSVSVNPANKIEVLLQKVIISNSSNSTVIIMEGLYIKQYIVCTE